jgi:hypothetical protein
VFQLFRTYVANVLFGYFKSRSGLAFSSSSSVPRLGVSSSSCSIDVQAAWARVRTTNVGGRVVQAA